MYGPLTVSIVEGGQVVARSPVEVGERDYVLEVRKHSPADIANGAVEARVWLVEERACRNSTAHEDHESSDFKHLEGLRRQKDRLYVLFSPAEWEEGSEKRRWTDTHPTRKQDQGSS